ncbi:MAG: DUF1415 domain-containing protein [Sutterellaceae bacterium]|nr:DUF1415 domain-containing protein [Burkholderiaceae bacterium]MCX7901863.1 DUF1415 domain-containing protein [Burkholderiaceae bacterium]MDW8428992.1 DUF1415 domain-containing protein [Sutterellaceae bacterium]
MTQEAVIAATRRWIERAVIGLNLCPFARGALPRLRLAVSAATTTEALLADLVWELQYLAAADPRQLETTLLIHPYVLRDFLEFNDFLDVGDAAVRRLGLEGVIQIASFHPQYRFAGTAADDIENYTNRAPYPILHLLREDSVARALAAVRDPASIYRRNVEIMRRLGHAGWARLWIDGSVT